MNTATQHTTEPWTTGDPIHEYQERYCWCAPVWANNAKSGGKMVAETYAITREQAHANARLIAAAPDLLEACEEFTDAMSQACPDYYGMSKAACKANAAIAKAKAKETDRNVDTKGI